jgi:hypothetical protein
MSWAEIKKALNTDLSVPLNTLIKNQISSLSSTITSKLTTLQTTANNANTNAQNAYNIVNNSEYGNSAIKKNIDFTIKGDFISQYKLFQINSDNSISVNADTFPYTIFEISGAGALLYFDIRDRMSSTGLSGYGYIYVDDIEVFIWHYDNSAYGTSSFAASSYTGMYVVIDRLYFKSSLKIVVKTTYSKGVYYISSCNIKYFLY